MDSVYDIAFSFVQTIYNKGLYIKDTNEIFNKVVDVLNEKLDNNSTADQLLFSIQKINKPITDTTNLFAFFGRPDNERENLLKSGAFYYHNLLRCMPAPPQLEWNIDTGEMTTINQPHFLEMRASLTLEEVVKYYCKRFDMTLDPKSINRYKGSIKYMIDKLGIDIVLFMIDTASDIITDADLPRPSSPVGIGEYEQQAREVYFAKVSENTVSGDDQIVFKQRILPCGNRWQAKEQEFSEEYFNYA